jgi:hypothetical protein
VGYRIRGLGREQFEELFALSDEELSQRNARRVIADKKPGFPCRATLEDAEPGESLILTNFVSHDAANPYRTSYAIYVRESSGDPPIYVDKLPPVLENRPLSLRGFDQDGMLQAAVLAQGAEVEIRIRELFERPDVATIHAHNAAYGCFAAKIERTE